MIRCRKQQERGDGVDQSKKRNPLRNKSWDELVAIMSTEPLTSQKYYAANAELTSRAAQAQEDAARYTKQNARWMFWSVFGVAITSIVNVLVNIWIAAHYR
jgi:hypothetical protein